MHSKNLILLSFERRKKKVSFADRTGSKKVWNCHHIVRTHANQVVTDLGQYKDTIELNYFEQLSTNEQGNYMPNCNCKEKNVLVTVRSMKDLTLPVLLHSKLLHFTAVWVGPERKRMPSFNDRIPTIPIFNKKISTNMM